MNQPDRRLTLPAGAVRRAREAFDRELSPEEFASLLRARWSPEEEQEARSLIAWFLRSYATPAQRLAKARQSYRQWARSAPAEALAADRAARDRQASAPLRDAAKP